MKRVKSFFKASSINSKTFGQWEAESLDIAYDSAFT